MEAGEIIQVKPTTEAEVTKRNKVTESMIVTKMGHGNKM